DPEAEVIALSPKTLLATNRFVCEICKKGFQRDQNLQLHRRGHNLPWKLKQRNHNKEEPIKKKAYVCPEPSCVHHHPSRALGDLTGIKKHFCRKHGEKKWKCEKCSKIYAVHSDWKAHSKTCGTREYRCDCGTLFSRYVCLTMHAHFRIMFSLFSLLAFCDALAEESARLSAAAAAAANPPPLLNIPHSSSSPIFSLPATPGWPDIHIKPESHQFQIPSLYPQQPPPSPPSHHLSATALLQKAATVAATQAAAAQTQMSHLDMGELGAAFAHHRRRQDAGDESASAGGVSLAAWQKSDRLTRDFLGLTGHDGGGSEMGNGREMLGYGAGAGVGLQQYGGSDVAMLMKPQGFGYGDASGTWGDC
ncbi:Protein indeterminate-domain 12, partial [Linum perenne]